MGAYYLTGLAEVARAAGLAVVEVDDWPYRARSSGGYEPGRPWAFVWHHTASQTTAENDVNYIVGGNDDSPIANLYLARDGVVWVCAGGATNTNGKGGPYTVSRGTVPVDSLNTFGVSCEIANSGVGEHYPQVQIDAAFTLSLAVTDWLGLEPTDALGHFDWTPGRKIDPATADAVQGPWQPGAVNSSGTWSLEDLHAELLARHTNGDNDMTPEQANQLTAIQNAVTATNVNIWGGPNEDPPFVLSVLGRLDAIEKHLGIDPYTGSS